MRVKRELLGKRVEVTWLDPIGVVRQNVELAQTRRGHAGLAKWIEFGLLDDITDGVLRVVHSMGISPGEAAVDEVSYTLVPEDRIITLFVLEPQQEAKNGDV